jgi:hypothetical protein
MKQDLTEIAIILDSSGSMQGCLSDTLGGLKNYLESQKNVPGECIVSVFNFASTLGVLTDHENVSKLDINQLSDKYREVMGGSTALYDAVGIVIDRIGMCLNATPEQARPSAVSIMIITDGEENASRRFNLARVQEMIKHQKEKYNWTFTFIGADITTDEAVSMNIDQHSSLSIDKSKIGDAISLCGVKYANFRGSKKVTDLSYSNEERSALS